MFIRIAMCCAAALISSLAAAQGSNNYRCANGDLVRRVEIVYETGVAVPCEVHYYKDTEAPGEREVLWNASSESGFCEGRTRELVAQLRSWGWTCIDVGAPAAGVSDDTDALSAGDQP